MKAKALYTILSKKYKDGEILFVDNFSISEPKTKNAQGILRTLAGVSGFERIISKKRNALYMALDKKHDAVEKSFRNIGNVLVNEARNMNPLDIMNYKYVMFLNPAESVAAISGKLAK